MCDTTTHCKDSGNLEPASSLLSTLTIARVRAKGHAKQPHTPLEHPAGQHQHQHPYGLPHSWGSGKHSLKHRHLLAGWGGSRETRTKAKLRETLGRLGAPRQRSSLAGCAGKAGG